MMDTDFLLLQGCWCWCWVPASSCPPIEAKGSDVAQAVAAARAAAFADALGVLARLLLVLLWSMLGR
eukprot:CAMPEP_0202364896 /NCGR_PEP_ID=MMETSP1126-20121109/16124_1 /ASSEMBLY_ACC=CAM_ASM_000457 /TAXON_ID=3047 /ORGANISM="Dunaliella tertiolecta, Strain CCMP1320" /LENGTH=66 /DNA_ID=CAMNT_0048959637 /DNA_START=2242 /DNA_END=2442 /DNA_ORIENTATION=-